MFHGTFPDVAPEGKLAVAGVYAPKLQAQGLLPNSSLVICPASELAEHADSFHVPTLTEVQNADGDALTSLQKTMGGSYGYSLGYVSNGDYKPTRNLNRSTFALMADAPCAKTSGGHSSNHGGCGQNVLFEDGHVGYLTSCTSQGGRDHIFLNDSGKVAAGLHCDDAVIGTSAAHPLLPSDEEASTVGHSNSR